MYIRKSTKKVKDKVYENYLLVESVMTPKGPRQKTIVSLGNLKPRSKSEWLELVQKVERVLSGQSSLFEAEDQEVAELAGKVKKIKAEGKRPGERIIDLAQESIEVVPEKVEVENPKEAGPVYVGDQFWKRLGLDEILHTVGMKEEMVKLTEAMVLNRLISPSSEHAMPEWFNRTAIGDMLGSEFDEINLHKLYRNLDRLHKKRGEIEKELAHREKNLFNLEDAVYLYDLTSTYFEGEAKENKQAMRGHSRDKRGDCKQVVVGLCLDREGFPKAHEVFEGNRNDKTTLEDMLRMLEKRVGKQKDRTVVVDRGMAFDDNLETIKKAGYHYIVACRQAERLEWLSEFEKEEGWKEVIRQKSPRNPFQKKSKVEIKKVEKNNLLYVLCLSEGRKAKDKAIREKAEQKLLTDLEKLQKRIDQGRLRDEKKIWQTLGRLKERYPRVARYYQLEFEPAKGLTWRENHFKKSMAQKLDGGYVLKTDRLDLSDEEIWKTYILLTRAEAAFRSMKSPLSLRPIFHHLEHRTQTHIFLCILAYHLLVSIEKTMLDKGVHTSWKTLRETLSTHQIATVLLPTIDGKVLRIRRGTKPQKEHLEIYEALEINPQIIKPVKNWTFKN